MSEIENAGCVFTYTWGDKDKNQNFEKLCHGNSVYLSFGNESDNGNISLKVGNHQHFDTFDFNLREIWADEIEGFIFGGFGSRFWLMKNYINLQPP